MGGRYFSDPRSRTNGVKSMLHDQPGATDRDLVPGGAGLPPGAGANVVHVGRGQVAGHRPQLRLLGE